MSFYSRIKLLLSRIKNYPSGPDILSGIFVMYSVGKFLGYPVNGLVSFQTLVSIKISNTVSGLCHIFGI